MKERSLFYKRLCVRQVLSEEVRFLPNLSEGANKPFEYFDNWQKRTEAEETAGENV